MRAPLSDDFEETVVKDFVESCVQPSAAHPGVGRIRASQGVRLSARGAVIAVVVPLMLVMGCAPSGKDTSSPDKAASGDAAIKSGASSKSGADVKAAAIKPALTVTLTSPAATTIPLTVTANGSVAAWQEAIIGAEVQGLKLLDVAVQVGDRVKRGQVLARLSADTLSADAAATRASVTEAEAAADEAKANAERARQLQNTGAISAQQIQQYLTLEATARARATALKARLRADETRLAQTRIVAPDDGIVSARAATVGAVVAPGQELFRLIRGGRLEWRAEVPAGDLASIKVGTKVRVQPSGGDTVEGSVRVVAPTVDATTRNGLVYVDLTPSSNAKAGMFARGEFELGRSQVMTLPQSAVLLRDGFAYVFRVGTDQKVQMTKVTVGRRAADRLEIVGGLEPNARVVLSGVGYLGDGDTVRVVDATTTPSTTAPAATKPASNASAAKP